MGAHEGGRDERRILVTGACGPVGRHVVERLAGTARVVALDATRPLPEPRRDGVLSLQADLGEAVVSKILTEHDIDTVVHVAGAVPGGPGGDRDRDYELDVLGTRAVLGACLRAGVTQLVYASSADVYGYHADNPRVFHESDPLRGNEAIPCAWHKRLAEVELATRREAHPELGQLVFRLGVVLGDGLSSPVTALFEEPVVLGVAGAESPFAFVWDEDVADCIVKGVRERRTGVFNLCGDGVLTLSDIAQRLGKPCWRLPAPLLAGALGLLRGLGVSSAVAERVAYLRYRPVPSNGALKTDFGFKPGFDSESCFEEYRRRRSGA